MTQCESPQAKELFRDHQFHFQLTFGCIFLILLIIKIQLLHFNFLLILLIIPCIIIILINFPLNFIKLLLIVLAVNYLNFDFKFNLNSLDYYFFYCLHFSKFHLYFPELLSLFNSSSTFLFPSFS